MPQSVYEESREQIIERLKADPEAGLKSDEAARRLAEYGPNSLQEKKRQSWLLRLLNQFKDVMVLILIAACAISAFFREWADALIILAIVIINAVLGLIQEGRAEKAIEALRKLTAPQARVIRDGQQQIIKAADLVPGDLVILEAGDLVPADLRLLAGTSLKAEEASLTGESQPSEKDATKILAADTALGDRSNLVFMSTPITYGRGRGLVYATGGLTEIGRIADRLQSMRDEMTPLQRNLSQMGKWLGMICVAVCVVVFAQGMLSGGQFLPMFLTAVSLAVAAIPEGLPAVVTIVLALGMKRMAERHAIVKRLLAVETLGSVDVICSDKTGTLTQNEMTVTRLFCPDRQIIVEGSGYQPEGRLIDEQTGEPAGMNPVLERLLTIGVLCNDAALVENWRQETSIIGDPTEAAILVAGAKSDLRQDDLQRLYPRISDLPFDSERKMMTTVHRGFSDAPVLSLTKGAPDVILARCTDWLTADGLERMTDERRAAFLEVNRQLAASALRVLAFTCKRHAGGTGDVGDSGDAGGAGESGDADGAGDVVDPEEGLTFVGLMGMIDPARPEVRDAIKLCEGAGIRPVMITGDYRDTAVAIARDLGMIHPGDGVLTGAEIDQLSDDQLRQHVEKTAIYARVSPDHKVRIVTALRANAHIASMTGDGVNDAMALKSADIGVAMGITGTDVAKGAADMILTDDNFATIVSAVREGRIIYSNIRKFVGFLLSCNVGEILVIFLSSLILGSAFVPLLPIQLLWLNLVTDSFPALALGQEQGEPDIMRQKPRGLHEPIMNRPMLLTILIQSLAIFGSVFAAFLIGLGYEPVAGQAGDTARTFAFVTLILSELLRSYSARSERYPVFKLGLFSNRTLNRAVGISSLLMLLVVYVPFLNPIFSTVPLRIRDWLIIIPLALIPAFAAEIGKWLHNRR